MQLVISLTLSILIKQSDFSIRDNNAQLIHSFITAIDVGFLKTMHRCAQARFQDHTVA